MAITQEQYFKKPEENAEQYNQRISGLRAIDSTVLTPLIGVGFRGMLEIRIIPSTNIHKHS